MKTNDSFYLLETKPMIAQSSFQINALFFSTYYANIRTGEKKLLLNLLASLQQRYMDQHN